LVGDAVGEVVKSARRQADTGAENWITSRVLETLVRAVIEIEEVARGALSQVGSQVRGNVPQVACQQDIGSPAVENRASDEAALLRIPRRR
jgi:hypothetical protein